MAGKSCNVFAEEVLIVLESSIKNISVVILTKNEQVGLGHTLQKLEAFQDVVVVDSDSTDETVAIAKSFGARVVNFKWDQKYPKKKQWSLDNSGVKNTWVLLLDADEFPDTNLLDELRHLDSEIMTSQFAAYDIRLSYMFSGRYLKYGHVVTKRSLLDRTKVRFPVIDDLNAPGIREVEGHYQPQTEDRISHLKGRLVHEDRDPVSSWFERHNRYSDWEVYLRTHPGLRSEVASARTNKGRLFDKVPGKSALFFLYSFVFRLGFLDGRAGLDYAIALSHYYWQIELKYRESSRG